MAELKLSETLTFQQERAQDCMAEAKPLLEAHWAETAHWDDISFDPEYEAYRMAEDAGMVRCYTVRDQGALIGYALFFVRANLKFRGSVWAVTDLLYLDPAARNRLIGARFIEWCDEQLAAEGVQVVQKHVTPQVDFSPFLARIGYEDSGRLWSRRLDRRT